MSAESVGSVPTPIVGDVLADTRSSKTQLYRLIYIDENCALLKGDTRNYRTGRVHHRLESRKMFDDYIEAGRFQPTEETADAPAMPSSEQGTEMDWTDIDGIGANTASELIDAGIETDRDAQRAGSDELLEIYGMSERIIEKMNEEIENAT